MPSVSLGSVTRKWRFSKSYGKGWNGSGCAISGGRGVRDIAISDSNSRMERVVEVWMDRYLRQVNLKRWIILFFGLALLAGSLPFIWRFLVQQRYDPTIYSVDSVPASKIAVVFGAGLSRSGGLSHVLRDRMDVAIALYEAGKVNKLLVSGDNRFENYDEPSAMKEYAIARGIPEQTIQPDFGGRRTYDTCYRARHIFQIDSAILVTQQFHLPRALFTCQQLGLDVVGVASDLHSYRDAEWFAVREVAATAQSAWDVIRKRPPPVMGEVIPIDD